MIFRSFIIAISMYSRIPLPHFEWRKDDMRYAICFFPFVGVVIALIEYLWLLFCSYKNIPLLPRTAVLVLVPVYITGGIHIDGFIDTSDALSAFVLPKKSLDILKDPHIGAFALIRFICLCCLYFCFASLITTPAVSWVLSFILSRILSAISVLDHLSIIEESPR